MKEMKSDLSNKFLILRFAAVSVIGTIADYLSALFLASVYEIPYVAASTCGFVIGSIVNYCGHTIFSYEHTDKKSISILGYAKYLLAVSASLVARLAVVAALELVTELPFWIVLACAIGASFVVSYVISTLWIFKKTD
jgi:putative flippase GtrA